MKRFAFTREFHIPKDAVLHFQDVTGGIEIYFYASNEKPCAIGFHGRAQKPDFRFAFRDEGRRAAYVMEYLRSIRAQEERRAERMAQRRAFVPTLKTGDILYTNWGYEQTNVEFYEVIEAKGKTCIIREIGQEMQQSGFMSGNVTPRAGAYCGEPLRRRIGENNHVRINDHIHAWLYDGSPKLCSWYA